MKILQVDGYTEHCGDWLLAGQLRGRGYDVLERECVQNWNALHVTLGDVLDADAVAGYSFGVASLWDVTDGWKKVAATGHKFKLGVIVAGCPDWTKGQFDVWTAPGMFERLVCLQPNSGYPTSMALKNAPWALIEDRDLLQHFDVSRVLNVDVGSLFPGVDPLTIHKTVMNHPRVLDLIGELMARYVPASVESSVEGA